MTKISILKHATPLMKYVHMNTVVNFKDQLKEHQAQQIREKRREIIDVCQKIADILSPAEYAEWWESTPEGDDEFLSCARAKLSELYARDRETTAQECERISQWLSDNWELIPEIPFGEGV